MEDLKHDSWYIGTPIHPTYGDDKKTGRTICAIVMKIIEGPLTGREVKYYNARWDRESNVHTFRKLRGCGWQGRDPDTIESDIKAAAGKRVRFQARWVEIGNGFWSADNMQPDGVYVQPVDAPSQRTREMMRQAIADAAEDDRLFQAQRAAQRGGGPGGDVERRGEQTKILKEGDWCPIAGCDAVIKLISTASGNNDLVCENGHEVTPF